MHIGTVTMLLADPYCTTVLLFGFLRRRVRVTAFAASVSTTGGHKVGPLVLLEFGLGLKGGLNATGDGLSQRPLVATEVQIRLGLPTSNF